jgi:tripartite-type tricarboxylate transporter receptor subunit TctC
VPGLGSSQHLTSELLLRAAGGLRVEHVPYRGGGPLLQDLLAGTVDAAVVTFAAAAQHAQAGLLRPLAVTGPTRPLGFPDLPTASETIAPGFVQSTWIGFFAPRATPLPVQARIHAAVLATLAEPAVNDRLAGLGFDPARQDGAAFGLLLDETIATFAGIAAERGIVAGT